MTALRYLCLLLGLIVCSSTTAFADKRIALVIGNSAYKNVARLTNPANDANLVGTMFKNAGFDLVDTKLDLGVAEIRKSLREFGAKARDADVAVIYYAGQAIELDGTNYLIPIDASLETDSDVLDEAVALDRVLFTVEPAKQLRLVILDACRDNPFAKSMKRTLASRSIGRGLAKVEPSSPNTMIAFSAKAGSTAADGDASNSPFAIAMVTHLPKPGLDLRRAFGYVRDDVLKATGNRQEPYVYGSLGGNDLPLVPAAPAAIAPVDRDALMRRDYEFAERIGTQSAFDAFVEKYPSGFYTALARAQREKLASVTPADKLAERATTPDPARGAAEPAASDRPKPAVEPVPATPAVVATLAAPSDPPVPARSDLPRLLRAELRRVGCTTADGGDDWDSDARRALGRFNNNAGTRFDTRLASVDALDAVKAKTGRVCPLVCKTGYRGDGDACVKIICGAGETMNNDGDCVAKRKEREKDEPARKKEPAVASRPDPSAPVHAHGKGCGSLSQRCAVQIGGRCDPATGHWEYGRNGAGGDTMAFNTCLSRSLAGGR